MGFELSKTNVHLFLQETFLDVSWLCRSFFSFFSCFLCRYFVPTLFLLESESSFCKSLRHFWMFRGYAVLCSLFLLFFCRYSVNTFFFAGKRKFFGVSFFCQLPASMPASCLPVACQLSASRLPVACHLPELVALDESGRGHPCGKLCASQEVHW
jgi:hypothetical protein